jgi:drug/metabolite transporter (DMT)-like permease
MKLLFVAALVVGLTGALAFLFGRLLKDQSTKRRIAGWVCMAVGIAFVLIHALEPEPELFVLAIGLSFLSGGLLALLTTSRQRTNASGQP